MSKAAKQTMAEPLPTAERDFGLGHKYMAEFVGTYILVLSIGCNVLGSSNIFAVISIASTLMVMIYCFGPVSGGHLNPAVTMAVKARNPDSMATSTACMFMVSQFLGGLCGAFTFWALMNDTINVGPQPGFNWFKAGLIEFLFTFMLATVVVNITDEDNTGREDYGLAIGFVVVAGGYAGGWISGGCFNPAVAFGLDVSSAGKGFGYCALYFLPQFAAGALAGLMTAALRPHRGYLSKDAFVEFLGTFFLVLTVHLNAGGHPANPANAFSIAASLMCMISAFGDYSGAHFNPAVTVAVLASGRNKIDAQRAGAYMAAQIAGGALASFLGGAIIGRAVPMGPASIPKAMAQELLFTFVLTSTVLAVATADWSSLKTMFGLAIGFCVVVGGYACKISGGHLNPAVSIALDTTDTVFTGAGWGHCLYYAVAQACGGGLAAMVYMTTHPVEYAKGFRAMQARGYGYDTL